MFFAVILVILLTTLSLASAINLEIEEDPINDVIIKELNNPAVFDFIIENKGQTDSFGIYSLIGVDIMPRDTFTISEGQTRKIKVEVKAGEGVKKNSGYFSFVYKIKGSNTGTQEERLTIRIIDLKTALKISADNINPDNEKISVYIENSENFDFEEIEAKFSSVFFDFEETFSLNALEKKSFTVDLDKEGIETLMAGPYILNADIKVQNATGALESTMKFLEKSGLSTEEIKEGIIISRYEIEKKNEGNLQTVAEITLKKNIISRLFTNFNLPPSRVERTGLTVEYFWQQELRPGESLTVVSRTNWHFPIIILVAIATIVLLFKVYFVSDIILKKKINFVKTKGGEFALKVSIKVRARRFVDRVSIIDRLPPIVKLYERYGTIAPDRVDEKNRRIEWNLESLDEGEDRMFSYIIYSKIGVVGRFELPPAKAIYEREGKIKETESNKVYFVSEPKKTEKPRLP